MPKAKSFKRKNDALKANKKLGKIKKAARVLAMKEKKAARLTKGRSTP